MGSTGEDDVDESLFKDVAVLPDVLVDAVVEGGASLVNFAFEDIPDVVGVEGLFNLFGVIDGDVTGDGASEAFGLADVVDFIHEALRW